MREPNPNTINKEKDYIDRMKIISIASLATAVAIMGNLLGLDTDKIVMESDSIRIAVTIFAVTIPYFVLDVYLLTRENIEGEKESVVYYILRLAMFIVNGIGLGFAFNHIPNFFNDKLSTIQIFIFSFLGFLVLRIILSWGKNTKKDFARRKDEYNEEQNSLNQEKEE